MAIAYLQSHFVIALIGALLLLSEIPLSLRLWGGCKAAQHSIGIRMQPAFHVQSLAGNTHMMLPILHNHRLQNGYP